VRPFLFLDVDGVLNDRESFKGATTTKVLSKKCVEQFKRIIAECNPEVVLSSTWRLYPDHAQVIWDLVGHELPATPERRTGRRGSEIAGFLANHPGRRYIIVDDDSDMLPEQKPYFIQTETEVGLTPEKADEIICLFKTMSGID
jgi:hypothetical protein